MHLKINNLYTNAQLYLTCHHGQMYGAAILCEFSNLHTEITEIQKVWQFTPILNIQTDHLISGAVWSFVLQ